MSVMVQKAFLSPADLEEVRALVDDKLTEAVMIKKSMAKNQQIVIYVNAEKPDALSKAERLARWIHKHGGSALVTDHIIEF